MNEFETCVGLVEIKVRESCGKAHAIRLRFRRAWAPWVLIFSVQNELFDFNPFSCPFLIWPDFFLMINIKE